MGIHQPLISCARFRSSDARVGRESIATVMSTSTAQEIFALAVERRRGGLLAEAETLCRQILAEQPRHADALALLALLAHQNRAK